MTRITSHWLADPAPQAVCAMLTDAGYQAWFVGGCVRNDLLGAPISDIDLSTDARPETVIALAENAGFKPVPTGIDHGTITVVAEGHAFEVTTFRKDIETDGRRAVIAYADSIDDDAHRRDFTMNALYAGPDGAVTDPLGCGLQDLRLRRVRFIDDPAQRIREDYLRILRFFRFHAWYGDPSGGLDADGLAACSENEDGIETLSRERVGQEMLKLLAAPDPAPSLAAMAQTGVLIHVLPGADVAALPLLVHFEADVGAEPDGIRRLACLEGSEHRERFRLSRANARLLDLLMRSVGGSETPAELGYRHGVDTALGIVLLRAALVDQFLPPTAQRDIMRGAAAEFPVKAKDLQHRYHGVALGEKLREIERRWIASDFQLTQAELLT